MTHSPFDILYEDNHLLAVDKPPGWVVQGAQEEEDSLLLRLKQFFKERDGKPGNVFLAPLHRLDRNVSGIVLLAKTSKGASRVNEAMRKGAFLKEYLALVKGELPLKGSWTHWMKKDEGQRKTLVEEKDPQSGGYKKARTDFQREKIFPKYSLVRIFPLSGRYHQIRGAFAREGFPLLGDGKYGGPKNFPRPALHAARLEFPHPITGESVLLSSPLPKDLEGMIS